MTVQPDTLSTVDGIDPDHLFHPTVDQRPAEIAEVSGAGIWLLDREMKVLFMNRVMEEIYGSITGKPAPYCYQLFRGRTEKCADCLPERAFATGQIILGYLSRLTPDGVHRYYQVIEAPLLDENNRITRVLEILLDITEKGRLEQTLRTSEAEYRALFEHAGTAVAVVGEDGVILRVNQRFEELSGYSRSEIEGHSRYDQFVHPKDRQRLLTPTTKPNGTPEPYQFSFLNRWGNERYVHATITRLPSLHHQVFSMIDLTGMRKLEREIWSKDQFLANILHHSVDAIAALDPQELIRSWNRGAELMFGYSSDEIVGKPFSTLLPPEFIQSDEFERISIRFRKDGFARNALLPAVAKDGRTLTINMTRTAITDSEGGDLGSSVMIRDETEQRKLEQRMIQQEKTLALGELAAGLAHEIKNPLNSLVIHTEVLRGHLSDLAGPHRAAFDRYEEIVLKEVQRLDKVVERVLNFSKPMEGVFERIDLREIVTHVTQLLSAQASREHVDLRTKVPDNLPPIEGVRDHLIQIFINLLLNAFQAMPKGGVATIDVRKGQKQSVIVSISDTGVGIPKPNYARVFDPYFSTKEKGRGLGLPLVKRLVTTQGGTISFKSRVNHGTTFILTFSFA
ncbi:MAG: PAS domain S-box protein [Pseudomonadota bacterium]